MPFRFHPDWQVNWKKKEFVSAEDLFETKEFYTVPVGLLLSEQFITQEQQ